MQVFETNKDPDVVKAIADERSWILFDGINRAGSMFESRVCLLVEAIGVLSRDCSVTVYASVEVSKEVGGRHEMCPSWHVQDKFAEA